MAIGADLLIDVNRQVTQAIGVAMESVRLGSFYRSATQGISIGFDAIVGFIIDRVATLGLSVASTGVRAIEVSKSVTLSWMIDFESMWSIPTDVPIYVNTSGYWVDYNYTSILTIKGTNTSLPSNMLNQTYWMDPYCYNVSETTGAPGLHVDFNITDLPEGLISISLRNYFSYDGSDGHTFEIQAYNGSEWVMVADIPDDCCQWFNASLSCLEGTFIDDDGLFRGRFYHSSPGNVNHEFCLAYGKLRAYVPFDVKTAFGGGMFFALFIIGVVAVTLFFTSRMK